MLSIINYFKGMSGRLSYNENRVLRGQAECILAAHFVQDRDELTYQQKWDRFAHLNTLHRATKRNISHISLSFSPKDELSSAKMTIIARSYMERIGFGDQPYLVYRHTDSGHPHCHILTNLISRDKKPVNVDFQYTRLSEPARKAMEKEFGLTPQRRRTKQEIAALLGEAPAAGLEYGKGETIKSVANAVDHILEHYNIVSLDQFNAILGVYNIRADRGSERSRMFQNGGLQYGIIDEQGRFYGRPFKASRIYSRPGLKKLEQVFSRNLLLRDKPRDRVHTWVEQALRVQPATMERFFDSLRQQQIRPVFLRQSPSHKPSPDDPLFYIDLRKDSVFSDRELGPGFSASALQQKFSLTPEELRIRLVDEYRPLTLETLRAQRQQQDLALNRSLIPGAAPTLDQTLTPNHPIRRDASLRPDTSFKADRERLPDR